MVLRPINLRGNTSRPNRQRSPLMVLGQNQSLARQMAAMAVAPLMPRRRKGNGAVRNVVERARSNTVRLRQSSPQSMATEFTRALVDPFHLDTMGARCPDMYSFPTATYHLHGNTVCVSGPSGGLDPGGFGVMLCPSPTISMIDLSLDAHKLNRAVSTTSMVDVGKTSGGTRDFTVFGAAAEINLQLLMGSQRIVSWGIKISSSMPELTATGRLFIALVPTGSTIPTQTLLAITQPEYGAMTEFITGMTAGYLNSSAIEGQPSAVQIPIQDLMHGTLMISGSYTNPNFFTLKNTTSNQEYNLNTYFGDLETIAKNDAAQTIKQIDVSSSSLSSMTSGVAIVVRGEGFPLNTNVINIEYIYHLEGSPGVVSGSGVPVPSASEMSHIGSTAMVEQAMTSVSGERSYAWIDKGLSFLNNSTSRMPVGQMDRANRASVTRRVR